MQNSANILLIFCKCSANYCKYSANILQIFCKYSANTLQIFCKSYANYFTLLQITANILQIFCKLLQIFFKCSANYCKYSANYCKWLQILIHCRWIKRCRVSLCSIGQPTKWTRVYPYASFKKHDSPDRTCLSDPPHGFDVLWMSR
jgi:hypothetical protein